MILNEFFNLPQVFEKQGTDNPYGYQVGQQVELDGRQQGQVTDIFDDSIEVLLPDGRTIKVDFRDAQVLDEQGVAEGGEGSGRRTADAWDTSPGRVGRVEKTAQGIRHHADPSRYGGSEPEPELYGLDKGKVNAMDKALGVKWDRESKRYYSPIKVDEQGVAEAGNLPGTPVVSLSDFGDKDNTKDRYGRTVPRKLKKDDPRVRFHPDYSQHEKKLISKMSNAEKADKGWRNPNIDEGEPGDLEHELEKQDYQRRQQRDWDAEKESNKDNLEEIDRRGFLRGLAGAGIAAAGLAASGAAQARATPEWMAKVAQAKELLNKGLTPEQVAKKLGVSGPNNQMSGPVGGDWGAINRAMQEVQRARGTGLNESMLMEDPVYRNFKRVGQYIVEYKMSEKQILDVFAQAEAGMTNKGTGANRTFLGKGKDATVDFAKDVAGAVKGVLNSIQNSVPVAAVDVAYDQATDALADLAGGQKGAVMQAIKKYRNLAKEYPKTAGFAKAALVAIAGLATGGAGLPAIAGLTYALDSAIKGDKLSSVLGKGAGAAALTAAAQGIYGATQTGSDNVTAIDTTQDYDVLGGGETTDYVVKKGDTLSDIAKANNVSVADLMKANSGQTIVKPNGELVTWNDANPLSDVNPMGDYVGPSTGVQQDYSVSTSPKISNPDVLAAGQTIKIPAPTGATPYAGDVGLAGDTWNKIGSEQYPYSQISANQAAKYGTLSSVTADQIYNNPVYQQAYAQEIARYGAEPSARAIQTAQQIATMKAKAAMAGAIKESVKFKIIPVSELIDKKLTLMSWTLNESVGKQSSRSVNLTTAGTLTVFENVDRWRMALMERGNVPGSTRPNQYRPDMPGGAGKKSKPGLIGRGLNALDRGAEKVGGALSNFGHQFTTKVTKEKLKMNWHQAGKPSDSDALAAWLVKQGVPQEVVTGVYTKMGIPFTAPAAPQPAAATTQPTATTPVRPTATTPATAPAGGKFPGEDPQGPGYVGRREVARRQAARDAEAAKKPAAPNLAQQNAGYKSVNYAPVAYSSNMKPAGTPKTPPAKNAAGGKSDQISKDEYIRRIGAPNLPEAKKPPKEADYGPEYQAMVKRMGEKARAQEKAQQQQPKTPVRESRRELLRQIIQS